MAESRALHEEFWERFMVAVRIKFDVDARFFVRNPKHVLSSLIARRALQHSALAAGSGALRRVGSLRVWPRINPNIRPTRRTRAHLIIIKGGSNSMGRI